MTGRIAVRTPPIHLVIWSGFSDLRWRGFWHGVIFDPMNPIARTKRRWLAGLLCSCFIWQLGVAQQPPISDEQRRFLEVRRPRSN